MSVLDAMLDTEKHEDAREFRWKWSIARLVPALSHDATLHAASRRIDA
jgi:hypothetical protein